MARSKLRIVIPLYKLQLDDYEKKSLQQCVGIFGISQITFVCGTQFDMAAFSKQYLPEKNDSETIRFADTHFEGIDGYNKLMLSAHFYKAFLKHQYILMFQLDAFVFSNNIAPFMQKGYSYIGAPWLQAYWMDVYAANTKMVILKSHHWLLRQYDKLRWKRKGLDTPHQFLVGNGGFSLRKTSDCFRVLQKHPQMAATWPHNDDLFWAIAAPLLHYRFICAPVHTALQFSFDVHPDACFERNKHQLPFGCHAWYRTDEPYNNFNFWKQFIPDMTDKNATV